jgi:endo-1,4-beta-mannosidase
MWVNYDRQIVRQELSVLAEHGCNVTRSFCFWPDFVPDPQRIDEEVFGRFRDFLDLHLELGLTTIPTFIVGHMSGENWDPSWRADRPLYSDVWMVAQQAWFAREVARRVASHAAVSGWLVSNEMPIYGGSGISEEVTSWAQIVVDAVRAGGGTQPISLGDGAWGIEVTGEDNGFSVRQIAPLVDFLGPHVYPMSDDAVRQGLAAAFACELSGTFDRPVVMEEFGVTSDFSSDDNAAAYYRQVLYSSLVAGAVGWLAWNNCDYDDLRNQDPYRHHPFEMHFGLTDASGRPKQQLRELARFSSFVAELDRTGWQRAESEVALVVPEYLERDLPFTTQSQRTELRANLLQGYIAAREADLPVTVSRELDGTSATAKLHLLPSVKALTAPGLDQLVERARSGATVYLSYFAGSTAVQRGPWIPSLDDVFGVLQQARYGLVSPVDEDEVELRFLAPLGDLAPGDILHFRAGGNANGRAFLPVTPDGAVVLAEDSHHRPALLRRPIGEGSLVLCAYPLEYFAACTPNVNPEETWRLYAALAADAGVVPSLSVADPRVICGTVRLPTSDVGILLNMSNDEVQVTPGEGWRHFVGDKPSAAIEIAPREVEILITRRDDE